MRNGWGLLAALGGAVGLGVVAAMVPWLLVEGDPPSPARVSLSPGIGAAPVNGQADLTGSTPCGFCQPLDALSEALARRAEGIGHRVTALESTLAERRDAARLGNAVASPDRPVSALEAELAAALQSHEAAMAAVARLDVWRKACRSDAVCVKERQREAAISRVTCPPAPADAAPQAEAARRLAREVASRADTCAALSCPVVTCTELADLRAEASAMLIALRTLADNAPVPGDDGDLTEALRRLARETVEEVRFVSRLYPLLFDETASPDVNEVLRLPRERVAARSQAIAEAPGFGATDPGPRAREIARRLEALRLDLLSLEEWSLQAARVNDGGAGAVDQWVRLADDLGAALIDAARLQTAAEAAPPASGPPCADSDLYAIAFAELRNALAALDLCNRRAGCSADVATEAASAAMASLKPSESGAERARARQLLGDGMARLTPAVRQFVAREAPPPSMSVARMRVVAGEPLRLVRRLPDVACNAAGQPSLRLQTGEAPPVLIDALPDPLDPDPDAVILPPVMTAGRHDVLLTTATGQGAAVLGRLSLEVEPPPATCNGFTGRWTSDLGELTLVVRGSEVSGAVATGPGQGATVTLVTGQVFGNVLRGRWIRGGDTGGLRLMLAPDGQSFAGSWGASPAETGGGGAWTGTCRTGG